MTESDESHIKKYIEEYFCPPTNNENIASRVGALCDRYSMFLSYFGINKLSNCSDINKFFRNNCHEDMKGLRSATKIPPTPACKPVKNSDKKYVNEEGITFGLLSKEDQEYIETHPDKEIFDGEKWNRSNAVGGYTNRAWRVPVPPKKVPLTPDTYHGQKIRHKNYKTIQLFPWSSDESGIMVHDDGVKFITWEILQQNWEMWDHKGWVPMETEG